MQLDRWILVNRKAMTMSIETIILMIVGLILVVVLGTWIASATDKAEEGTGKSVDTASENTNCVIACARLCSGNTEFDSTKAVNHLVCGDKDNIYLDNGQCQEGVTPNPNYINCECLKCDGNKETTPEPGPDPVDPITCTVGTPCGDPNRGDITALDDGTIVLPDLCCNPEDNCDTKVCPNPNPYTWTKTIYNTPTEGGHTYLGKYIGTAWNEPTTIYDFPGTIEVGNIKTSTRFITVPGDILSNGGVSTDDAHIYYCVDQLNPDENKFLFLNQIQIPMWTWAGATEDFVKITEPTDPFTVFFWNFVISDWKDTFTDRLYDCNLVLNQNSINAIVGEESPVLGKGGSIIITVGPIAG